MIEPQRTLVVDDEEAICYFLSETLTRDGHIVTTAGNGEEAIGYLQNTAFDLVILDLKLPGLVDGQRVLEAIRWSRPATAVVMLTAYSSLESADKAIQEEVDAYLVKPVRPADVRLAIIEAFRHRQEMWGMRKKEGNI